MAVIAAAVVLLRAVWVVSRVDGSWSILCTDMASSFPPFLRPQPAIDESLKYQKLSWLLAEADRLFANPSVSATDCMSAAVAIRSAHELYWYDIPPNLPAVARIIWNKRSLPAAILSTRDDAMGRLEQQLSGKVRVFASKATQLEPERKDWWRLCALLAGNEIDLYSDKFANRDLMAQVPQHDPDNALYDYIRAFDCIRRAYQYNPVDDGDPTVSLNGELLMEAWLRSTHAIRKSFLATGIDHAGVAAEFCKNRQEPITVKLGLVRPEVYPDSQRGLVYAIRAGLPPFSQ